jgi:hypothetical protein
MSTFHACSYTRRPSTNALAELAGDPSVSDPNFTPTVGHEDRHEVSVTAFPYSRIEWAERGAGYGWLMVRVKSHAPSVEWLAQLAALVTSLEPTEPLETLTL